TGRGLDRRRPAPVGRGVAPRFARFRRVGRGLACAGRPGGRSMRAERLLMTSSVASDVTAVRPGESLDWAALDAWLRRRRADAPPGVPGLLAVFQFPTASATLTSPLRIGDHELVLRRPPFGEIAPGAHDMKREFKVLSRLWRHFDRAPRAYVFGDPAVL